LRRIATWQFWPKAMQAAPHGLLFRQECGGPGGEHLSLRGMHTSPQGLPARQTGRAGHACLMGMQTPLQGLLLRQVSAEAAPGADAISTAAARARGRTKART